MSLQVGSKGSVSSTVHGVKLDGGGVASRYCAWPSAHVGRPDVDLAFHGPDQLPRSPDGNSHWNGVQWVTVRTWIDCT
jgi:hypothetical protein